MARRRSVPMNYRRNIEAKSRSNMWTLGVEPSPPVLQTGALPSKLSPRSLVRERVSAASGTGTRDLLRDKQALCLPELWRRFVLFSCQRTTGPIGPEEEGEGFEPSRPLSKPSALAVRRLQPLGQPSMLFASQRRVRDSNSQGTRVPRLFSRQVPYQLG